MQSMLTPKLNENDALRKLISNIVSYAKFDHPLNQVDIAETNISYILLTGKYAYKFKKGVDLGFLNFTELEERKFYCEEEVRLNRRLAPDMYLDVIRITGNRNQPEINGAGPVIEYAVKMRQFKKNTELDYLLRNGLFKTDYVDQLAEDIAAFHTVIKLASPDTQYGSYDVISRTTFENIRDLASCITHDKTYAKKLDDINGWSKQHLAILKPIMLKRKEQGYIRECHGDLHLGNIALHQDKPIIFDCIEFSEDLRWIDTICDIAFLIMDFESYQHPVLAYRFLNNYLEHCGDYEGLTLLRFYCAYRALVRAKVYALGLSKEIPDEKKHILKQQYQHYIELALNYTRPNVPFILITHGLSGSGKTTITRIILEELGAIRIRSDIERKRLNKLDTSDSSHSGLKSGLYTQTKSDQVYQHLADISKIIIQSDYPVIVDATFLDKQYRALFKSLASGLKVPFIILNFLGSKQNLMARIQEREKQAKDASEADIKVLEHQLNNMMPLETSEQNLEISIDTNTDIDYPNLINKIKTKLSKYNI